MPSAEPAPWYEAYPKPRNTSPESITRSDLLQRMHDGQKPGKDFLLVDLRRTDHEGGTIRGSLNLPAHSLYHSLPTLYALCTTAKIHTVIWYCGSSLGRGPRAAGWFDDVIQDNSTDEHIAIKSVTLEGGVKGWVAAGGEFVEWMDGFDSKAWKEE